MNKNSFNWHDTLQITKRFSFYVNPSPQSVHLKLLYTRLALRVVGSFWKSPMTEENCW